jgi:glycine betaine/choline ABC-type transport system substrate-binding protein
MDRRGFLIGTGAVLVTGCARVVPPDLAAATPAASAAALTIGSDGTPPGVLLAELLTQALTAKGRAATVVAAGDDWQAALADASLTAVPGYAATLWAELSDTEDSPAGVEDLLSNVAGFLAPEVSMLPAPAVDGGLVWDVTQQTAASGITSLDRIAGWSKGKVVAIPPLADSRSDGIPGITGVYHAAFTSASLADASQRASRLASGQVAVAAFRRTEYTGVTSLVTLEDPDEIGLADPLVVLLGSALAEADPDAVLAMDAVTGLLTTDILIGLQAKMAAGSVAADVAGQWLTASGLA